MEDIIKEKISADHLLYVSLKYTKTCGVMLNLIHRWSQLIELSVDKLLEKAKKKKIINSIPTNPKSRNDKVDELFKKNKDILTAIELNRFFKLMDDLQKINENEFRKNVTLKVMFKGEWININMDKLKEYAAIVERFISAVKQFLTS
jgi:hypothetical protein